MKTKITKKQAWSLINQLIQYVNGLNYTQISQTQRDEMYEYIDKICEKLRLIKE